MSRRRVSLARLAPYPRILAGTWVAVLGMMLMISSDYRFSGGRAQTDALQGQADSRAIAVVGVFGLAATFLLFVIARPPTGRRVPAALVALWGFTFAMVLLSIWSPYPKLAAARSVQLIITAWLAHAIARYARPGDLWRLCHYYVVVITGSIAFGVVVHLPPIDLQQAGRFTWLYLHPNIAGSFLAASTVILMACLLLRRAGNPYMTWPTWWYGLGLAVHAGALIATQSRGALAATAAAIMVVLWSGSRRRSRLDLMLLGLALIAIVWILAGGDIILYLQRGDSAEELGTLNSRTEVWSEGWRLFLQRPLLGHGFMSARGAFLQSFGLGGAHNAFVEAMVDGGAFGLAWFTAAILLGMRSAGRLATARRPEGPVLQGLILALVVNGFTEGGLAQAATVQNVWLYVAIGWAVAAHRWKREDEAAERAALEAEQVAAASGGPARSSISSGRNGRARPAR